MCDGLEAPGMKRLLCRSGRQAGLGQTPLRPRKVGVMVVPVPWQAGGLGGGWLQAPHQGLQQVATRSPARRDLQPVATPGLKQSSDPPAFRVRPASFACRTH